MTGSRVPTGASSDLVRQARDGDDRAFGRLYELYADRVYRYVNFRVRHDVTARDLTQDVFVNALRGLGRLQDLDRFEGWLMRIAHNQVVNHWRRRKSRPQIVEGRHEEDDADEPLARIADESRGSDPDARAERILRLQAVGAASGRLTELQQEVIGLRFGAGLSLAETSAIVGRSEDAVKKLQRRALRSLQRSLNRGEI